MFVYTPKRKQFQLPSNTIDKAWISVPEIIIPVQWLTSFK